MEDPKKIKEALLMERIVELINSLRGKHGYCRCQIHRFMRKKNINSVIDFINIPLHRPNYWDKDYVWDRDYVGMGPITYKKIGEIQKIIVEENKKHLKKVSAVTYKWELVSLE